MAGLRGRPRRGRYGDEDNRMRDETRATPAPDSDSWPVVPYTPIRCPEPNCGNAQVRYGGRYGRTRYHQCTSCGVRFKSWETGDSGRDIGENGHQKN